MMTGEPDLHLLIKDYYSSTVKKEWQRLVKDAYHRLEFNTTLHFLDQYLPADGHILDAGGGPGRYTLELARRGYDLTLLDMTPANFEFARRQIKRARLSDRVTEIVEGSIVDLSQFENHTFDAVICLGGPLSHVVDQADRAKAVSELIRVAKKGAPIIVSVLSRLSVLVVQLMEFQHEFELSIFPDVRDRGDYPGGYGFTACHFFLPEDFESLFHGKGVEILEMAGLEGLGSHHNRKINQLSKHSARWKIWWETHLETCTHPAVVGLSEHMLLVCRKI
jgi:SAM-dependent methyltransferase